MTQLVFAHGVAPRKTDPGYAQTVSNRDKLFREVLLQGVRLLAIGDSAWSCLHATFDPQWVKVIFRGRQATLSVTAAGGFGLGMWLPAQKIELEYDLAGIAEAPWIIRER